MASRLDAVGEAARRKTIMRERSESEEQQRKSTVGGSELGREGSFLMR